MISAKKEVLRWCCGSMSMQSGALVAEAIQPAMMQRLYSLRTVR